MTFIMHWKQKDGSENVLGSKPPIILPPPAEQPLGACGNGHVGTRGDVCTAVGCNGTPFR